MIASGIDGLSRGNASEGLMLQPSATAFGSFVPLHLSAIQCSPDLLPWLRSWILFRGITPLSPTDWFVHGHGLTGRGTATLAGGWDPELSPHRWFLWDPAPAAAGAAGEELGVSRHKRPHLNHVFICPRLFTQYWRKWLYKIADVVLELPLGIIVAWPAEMHEPLLVALTLCFATPTDEDGFDWQPPSDLLRHRQGRHGDHLICPFQCDECHFLNIMSRRPVPDKAEDVRMLNAIRRANLDAFWSREPPTVTKNLQDARRAVRISQS